MSIETLPAPDTFRSSPIRGLPSDADVDRKSMTIRGVKAMQVGPLNSGDARPWKVDQTTLEQLQSQVNQRSGGTKMRFSHPNMSRDGMGRHLGRASNGRIVGEGEDAYLAVDAKLSEAAKRTPNGNLAEYVLDLADESPEDFGLSIAPLLDLEAMAAAEQEEKKAGKGDGLQPIRISGLRAIDFVDEPAATRGGLFSVDSDSPADLPAQATWLLDTFFADAAPDVVRGRFDEFLARYFASKGETMTTTEKTNESKPSESHSEESEAMQKELAKQDAAKAELKRRGEITALCQLAKVGDVDRDLMIDAGFSRADAQDFLKSSGRLSVSNPPVDEGANDLGEKQTDEEKFGAEYDAFESVYERQGVSREDFIASRKLDIN